MSNNLIKNTGQFQSTVIGDIPLKWKLVRAEKFCVSVIDGTHDSPRKTDSGKLLVTSKNIKNNHLDLSSSYYISIKDFQEVNKRSKVDKWDVLLSMIGTVGEACIIDDEPDFAIKNVGLFKCGEKRLAKWIFYFLISKYGRNYILSRLSGTTQKYITLGSLRSFPIPVPKKNEMERIVKILSSFDDKIELLRKQNKTLTEIAQTVFNEWFGKYQVGDELPEGWKVGTISDFNAEISDFVANGSFASLKENVTLGENGYALFMRNTDLKSSFVKKVYVDKKGYDFLKKTQLYGGEIIISNVGDVGSVYFCPKFNIPMSLGNNVIMLKSSYQNYLYTLFKSYIGQYLINSITGGSAQPKFNKTDFRNMLLIVPDKSTLEKFENISNEIYEKISENAKQIQTLSKTRNVLLPKLMSGKIRVNEKNNK